MSILMHIKCSRKNRMHIYDLDVFSSSSSASMLFYFVISRISGMQSNEDVLQRIIFFWLTEFQIWHFGVKWSFDRREHWMMATFLKIKFPPGSWWVILERVNVSFEYFCPVWITDSQTSNLPIFSQCASKSQTKFFSWRTTPKFSSNLEFSNAIPDLKLLKSARTRVIERKISRMSN